MTNFSRWPRLIGGLCLSSALCVALVGCGSSAPATNTPAPTATTATMATATATTAADEASATDTPAMSAEATVTMPEATTAASGAGSTAGWQTVANDDNNCQIQVPADWVPTGGGGAADPTFLAIATVGSTSQYASLSDLKQAAPTAFQVGNILQDTPAIYSFEYKSAAGAAGQDYYAAAPANGHLCITTVAINSDGAVATLGPTSQQVVGTLAAK